MGESQPVVSGGYGARFTFVLHGPFPAVPTWIQSGIVAEELELIYGGKYEILKPLDFDAKQLAVRLRFLNLLPLRSSRPQGSIKSIWST